MFYVSGWSVYSNLAAYLLLAAFAAYWISKRYGVSAAIFFWMLSANAIGTFELSRMPLENQDPIWIEAFNADAAGTLTLILLAILAVRALKSWQWILFLQLTAISNAFLILGARVVGVDPNGLLYNPSMSGCLNAVLLPLFFSKGKLPLFVLLIIPASILACSQSQPIALLFILLGLVLLRRRYFKTLIVAIASSFWVGYWITGKELFNPSGRIEVWTYCMTFWRENADSWKGMGLGSFFHLGPKFPLAPRLSFLWLHSDWLQILFETGWPVLAASILMYVVALFRSYRRENLFTSLVAYGVWMLANFPLHTPISAMVGLIFVHWSLGRCDSSSKNA